MIETFKNAPITEALLDIQVILPNGVDAERLLAFHDLVKEQFPEKRDRLSWNHSLQWQIGHAPQFMPAAQKQEGYLFISADKTKIVQARINGFTFNKLKPYANWDTLSTESRSLWEEYRQLASPLNVLRIGLRYLNRIEIPLPVTELRQFCVLFPDLPPGIPQALREFFLRFVVPEPDSGAIGIVTLTFEPMQQSRAVLPLILDIDVFFPFEAMPPNTDELWVKFGILREFKNRIFFSSVTENAKKLFR